MINPNNFYTVQGWMISELGLKGNALAVYAIIYGFSQDGASEYSGSARYLCEWLGCSRSTVMLVLKNLVEKGYLEKRDYTKNGITYCTYTALRYTCPKIGHPVLNSDRGASENQTEGVQKPDTPCPKTGHNNIDDIDSNSYIDKDIDTGTAGASPDLPPEPPAPKAKGKKKKDGSEKPPKKEYGEFKHVKLTDDELAKLIKKHGEEKTAALIQFLDEYIEDKPKYKSESHYLAICRWVVDAVNEKARRQIQNNRPQKYGHPAGGTVGPNGIAIDPTKTDLDGAFR